MQCDDDCPQYKSAKLCSHVVAAAQHNNQLDQFIASYSGQKKHPNITKLATSATPKGRGRKGSKAPAKRRPPLPIESRMEFISPSTESITALIMTPSMTPVSVAPVYNQSINAPIAAYTKSYLPAHRGTFMPFQTPNLTSPHPMPFNRSSPFSSDFPCTGTPFISTTPLDTSSGGAHPFRLCLYRET